jgi:hypothetical protein
MIRTQVYLTEEERIGLEAVAGATGKRQSELIRDAVDLFLDQSQGQVRDVALKAAAGMWKDRSDLPDFEATRRSWDRG